jgi:hypothetical protein
MHERIQDVEHQALEKIAFLETELVQLRQERDELAEFKRHADEEVSTLRRVVQHHEQESKNRQSMFESKIAELENVTKSLPKGASSTDSAPVVEFFLIAIGFSACLGRDADEHPAGLDRLEPPHVACDTAAGAGRPAAAPVPAPSTVQSAFGAGAASPRRLHASPRRGHDNQAQSANQVQTADDQLDRPEAEPGARDHLQRVGRRQAAPPHRLQRLRGAVQDRERGNVGQRQQRDRRAVHVPEQEVQEVGERDAARAHQVEEHRHFQEEIGDVPREGDQRDQHARLEAAAAGERRAAAEDGAHGAGDQGVQGVRRREEERQLAHRRRQVFASADQSREDIGEAVDNELHRQLLRQSAPDSAGNKTIRISTVLRLTWWCLLSANSRHHLRVHLGEELEEAAIGPRNNPGVRELSQQQQTGPGIRVQAPVVGHPPRHQIHRQADVPSSLHRRHDPAEVPRTPQLRFGPPLHRESRSW